MAPIKKFAIIISTTREPRVGPAVTGLVHKTLSSCSDRTEFNIIDIRDFNLPLFDEPEIPQKIMSSDGYTHEHTRVWSREIYKYDGFVFVTAQYNWSIPASLKNALDFLFNEWKLKPAFIVSYGGHGGGKAASALMQICQGLKMDLYAETVQLPFHGKKGFLDEAFRGVLMEDAQEVWRTELDLLKSLWMIFERTLHDDNDGEAQ